LQWSIPLQYVLVLVRGVWAKDMMDFLNYELRGPTTVHMEQEMFLLVSMTLLTVSNLSSVYTESFGSLGDAIFLCFCFVWLSRYLVIRWICTYDISTSAVPRLRGVVARFISTHIMAGQYFDRPKNHTMVEDDRRVDVYTLSSTTALAFSMPTTMAVWDLFCVRVMVPILKMRQEWLRRQQQQKTGFNNIADSAGSGERLSSLADDNNVISSSNQTTAKRRGGDNNNRDTGINDIAAAGHQQRIIPPMAHKIIRHLTTGYNMIAPTIQIIAPLVILASYAWRLRSFRFFPSSCTANANNNNNNNQGLYSYYAGGGSGDPTATTTSSSSLNNNDDDPFWPEVFLVMACPTILSLLIFNRFIIPFPDLVAGSNVLKAIRSDTKTHGGLSSVSQLNNSRYLF
jgi:hypothetical protein